MSGELTGAFSHRGFMLDVVRHYMPVGDIEKLIRAASVCGMNRMHWHLTDDQGWRVEILRYPRLTEKGSVRGETFFGGVSRTENNSGYYTREQVRHIVSYAREYGIEIIPEIEIPGHAGALLAAYPEFGCARSGGTAVKRWDYRVEISGGIFPSLICAGREETRRFLKDVLDEITELFPFPMVHIGGDEALKLHWRRCPDCRRRMRELSLSDENELQRELVLDIGAYLAEKGRDTVVWSDVLEGGMLPPHFIVQQWYDDEERTERFMEQGGRVICSDCKAYYLDYPYGRIDVKTIREFPRVPKYARGREDRLLGLECPLWTERVTNIEKAAFQLFPRMCAVGIKALESGPLSDEEFNSRVAEMTDRIRAMGLNAAPMEYWEMSAETAERDRIEDRERIHAPEAEKYVEQEQTLVLLEKTERFMRKLSIPEEFLLRAGDRILAGVYGQDVLPDEDGEEELARQLMEAVRSREEGAWRRFPEEIWLSTMGCFPRFISEYRASCGRDGFDRGFWTVRQVGCRLFRIGELEYELAEDSGEGYISLHIPSDAVLDAGRLNDSLERAKAFLRDNFPERYGERFLCESWLLSPALEDLLPADSRIRRFRRAFTITDIFPDDDSALQWVFGTAEKQKDTVVPEDLPEKTSLQRAMKARLLSGGKPGSAIGILTGSFS